MSKPKMLTMSSYDPDAYYRLKGSCIGCRRVTWLCRRDRRCSKYATTPKRGHVAKPTGYQPNADLSGVRKEKMRYYEVYFPGEDQPWIVTAVRSLHHRTPLGLPPGTKVYRTITERDGSLVEQTEIPVVDGRVRVRGLGKRKPKSIHGRF